MTNKKFAAVLGLAILLTVTLASQYGHAQGQGGTVKVKVHYKGSGKVDDSHKVLTFLFDSPDFVKGTAIPFAVQASNSKDGSLTFASVSKSPVYVATVYDPAGAYDGTMGPPPKGASLGMYATTPGTPAPLNVVAGKTAAAEVTFDDSVKMQ